MRRLLLFVDQDAKRGQDLLPVRPEGCFAQKGRVPVSRPRCRDASGMAAMEGVKVHVIRADAFKGAGKLGTEVTVEHLNEMQRKADGPDRLTTSPRPKAGRRASALQSRPA